MSLLKRLVSGSNHAAEKEERQQTADEVTEVNASHTDDMSIDDIARSIRAQLAALDPSSENPAVVTQDAQTEPTLHVVDDMDELSLLDDVVVGEAKTHEKSSDALTLNDEWVSPFTDDTAEDTQDYDGEAAMSTEDEDLSQPLAERASGAHHSSSEDVYEIPPSPRTERMNLGDLRLDIVRITSDIENGEALYRRAQQRVNSLVGFIEQAEVAVSVLNKIEPENRRLKSRNRDLESETEAHSYKIANLKRDLESEQEKARTAHRKVDGLRAQLTDMQAALEERTQEAKELVITNDELKIEAERINTDLGIETRENANLRQKMEEMTTQMEDMRSEHLDIKKSAEARQNELDSLLADKQRLEADNGKLHQSLHSSEQQGASMRSEMIEIQEKVFSFKSQHEAHIHRRDDKIVTLEARLIELEKTLKHKEEIINSTSLDVSELRRVKSRYEMEQEKLEKTIKNQAFQLDKISEENRMARMDIQELRQRNKDLAETLSLTRSHRDMDKEDTSDFYPVRGNGMDVPVPEEAHAVPQSAFLP